MLQFATLHCCALRQCIVARCYNALLRLATMYIFRASQLKYLYMFVYFQFVELVP